MTKIPWSAIGRARRQLALEDRTGSRRDLDDLARVCGAAMAGASAGERDAWRAILDDLERVTDWLAEAARQAAGRRRLQ